MMKINMDCREEISDSDSGIILNSGPDSPTSPVKDLSSHTHVLRRKQQTLEDRLELCVLELKKLCVREAELTGKLPCDYPLLPHEKPPHISRRTGARFKLNEGFISQDGEEQHTLESDVTPQWQTYEATHELSLEENLSKAVRRQQQCKREEKTLKELQEAAVKHHIHASSPQPFCSSRPTDFALSDDSSLSDAVAVDDDLDSSPVSAAVLSSSTDSSVQRMIPLPKNVPKPSSSSSSLDYEPSTFPELLDQPYQKAEASLSACSSGSSSPTFSPDSRLAELPPAPHFVFKSLPVRNTQANSAPSSPDLPLRHHCSQPCRLPRGKPELTKTSSDLGRGRTKLPERRVTDFALTYSLQRLYQCSSEDSSSELSISSSSSSSSKETTTETLKPRPPPYGYQHTCCPPKNNASHPEPTPNPVNKNNGVLLEVRRLRTGPNPQSGTAPANKQVQLTSAKRMLRPPPPYTKVVRTTSLRENPNHPIRWLSPDVKFGDLKSWHQINCSVVPRCHSLERQKTIQKKRPEPPAYHQIHKQVSQKVILQRAADGTPVQWYEEEDSEIVSQV